ncbi:chemotaxis protein CheW [Methylocystis sp. MJC1]|uniref:hybrid sensor histidine kinase/response regulator n=1 Tax=Methylocystis sp. MJC1 TaxID=2654282 RepID=UPI0013EC945F|nr:hybrid sensor histidine kinase/response regulator [Methylocystis sp. MJC1]KAF2990335.1 Chemotaxis protein CheA [Methylocystis sp. MJC1]MBU6528135.1 chemotaxis protein CheW [Methylocystis sp. MJC1]UZX11047.1 chemotaxis protein CheW [Methylocystis sp. MJC1]
MDDLLKDFLQEATEHIDATSVELLRFEKDQTDPALVASLFRHIHTIKGSSGFLSLPRVARLTHATETLIGRLRDGATATSAHVSLILAAVDRLSMLLLEIARNEVEPEGDDRALLVQLEQGAASLRPKETLASHDAKLPATPPQGTSPAENISGLGVARLSDTVRVSVGVLDRLVGIVSELVLTRNQLLELSSAGDDEIIKAAVQSLSSVTGDLQDAVMQVRMQPVERLFATLPRLVRDLSLELGKKIELVTLGGDTELDRQVIELIRAPLTHIIRNAADHGIETGAERLALGKPEAGRIRVSATYDAGQITIEIKDDGRGLDRDAIKAKASALGLATKESLARMNDADIFEFVMLPGFSTAPSITKISGRGVGMDVVRANIQSIGGAVFINSAAGKGSTVILRIPLTLAIAPALILSCGRSRFAVLQMAVIEVVGVGEGFDHQIQLIHNAPVLRLRGDALPLVDLAEVLDLHAPDNASRRDGYAVILRVGGVRFGLLVETIADVQEIVIEPLAGPLARIGVFSGQTILGDGGVALILDPAAIMETVGLDNLAAPARPALVAPPAPEREKTRIILLRAGGGPLKALPLSLVMRIEEVTADCFVASGDGYAMLYEKRLLPIFPAAGGMQLDASRAYPILVLAGAGQAIGLFVEEVIDVLEEELSFQKKSADPRIIGTVSINGQIVEVLDVAHFIETADPGILTRGINKRPRILLVDDKQFFRDMLAPVLLAAGYDVTTAASGHEALDLVEGGLRIDAAVTDIDMPDMDGYALARALLQAPGRVDLPVVALAPQKTAKCLEAAALCGVRALVGKFDRRALVETLGALLDGVAASGEHIERRIMAEAAA